MLKQILHILKTKTLLLLLQRTFLWNEEKYSKYRCHLYTHVQGSFLYIKADRLCTIPPKWNPNWFLLILPAKVPLTCPTPALQSFTTLVFADMSSSRTEGLLCTSACKTFLAHYPAILEMLLHYPEKNARFGNKSKYAFLGTYHSQTHRTAWLLWSPVQEMGVKGGGGEASYSRRETAQTVLMQQGSLWSLSSVM